MSTSTLELKQIFEYELRNKLSLKAKRNTSEVILLINAFRFYDIFNTNTVNTDQWIKTFSKIGLIGFTDKDMTMLFNYYDYNQKGIINYKNFAKSLYYDNENELSFPQIGTNEQYIPNESLNNIKPIQNNSGNSSKQIEKSYQQYQHQPQPQLQSQSQQQMFDQQQPSQESKQFVCPTPLKNEVKKYFQSLLDLISNKININNGIGYFVFASKLKETEEKLYKVITYESFYKSLNEMQINLSERQSKDLFSLLDLSDKKCISIIEFLRLLQRPLSEKRRNTIITQFAIIDQARRGHCQIDELKAVFNPKQHPEVKYGRKTENDVYQEFTFTLNAFIILKDLSKIAIEDFIEYYAIISGSIDDDSYFEMLLNAIGNSSNAKFNTNQYMSQQNSLELTPSSILRNTPNLNMNINDVDKNREQIKYNPINNTYHIPTEASNQMQNQSINSFTITPTPMPIFTSTPSSSLNEKKDKKYLNPKEFLTQSILKLRHILISRGTKGIFGLQRMLKLYDKKSTNTIHISDFDSLCQAYRLDITPEEINAIFSIFDYDQKGIINYNSLIKLLIGEMNESRTLLVKKAFSHLDRNKQNSIEQNDIKVCYNSSRHPEVVLGKKTQDEVLGEWLDNLDAFCLYNDIPLHQRISFDEFMRFYIQISMSIEDDRYFDYMVNNVWNLDRENSSKQR